MVEYAGGESSFWMTEILGLSLIVFIAVLFSCSKIDRGTSQKYYWLLTFRLVKLKKLPKLWKGSALFGTLFFFDRLLTNITKGMQAKANNSTKIRVNIT